MSLYDRLKKSIEESEYDKNNNSIEWIAQFNAKDDINEEIVKFGIRKEGSLFWIYYSFDINNSDMCGDTMEEAVKIIEKCWGYNNTFKWIK
jgi:hypothetical protein